MRIRGLVLTIFIVLFLVPFVYSEDQPIVSIPQPIKNYVDFYNESDYAIYKLEIINPANYTINYTAYTISPDWIIIYGDGNELRSGFLGPNERKTLIIYARPSIKTTRVASFLLTFYNENTTNVEVHLSPLIIYKLQKEPKELFVQNVSVYGVSVYPEIDIREGDTLTVFISIYNPNDFEISLPIIFNFSFGLYREYLINLSRGNNVIQDSFIIPTGLNITGFKLTVLVGENEYQFDFKLLKEIITPNIEIKDGLIIITNPSKIKALVYTFELPYSKWDFLMYRLYPYPKEYVIRNNKIYARWEIILLPQESFIIKKQLDIYFILVLLVIAVLFIAFLISLLRPRVEIRKEIVRLSLSEGILRVAIYIKNKSVLPIKYVIIRDRIPSELKVKKYDVSTPSGVYKEDKETILEWSYEYIRPKEEIIISYTIEIPKDLKQKTISLPSASITYNYLYMSEKTESSNTVSVTMVT